MKKKSWGNHKWSAMAVLLAVSGTAQAGVHWGDWKRDACTKPGYRQYSSVLWDIPWGASWELTCTQTPVLPNYHTRGLPSNHPDRASRCKVAGGRMWGEVDVRDTSCDLQKTAPTLTWGDFKKNECTGDKLREYSAQLMNVPGGMDWQEACKAAQGIKYKGTAGSAALAQRLGKTDKTSLPDRCNKGSGLGITTGIWGAFDVEDTSCKLNLGDLTWGAWKQGKCITVPLSLDERGLPSGSRLLREYSSVLWNIPPGQSWENACRQKKVEISYGNGQKFERPNPDLCVKATGNDLFRLSTLLATSAAGYIKGIGTSASVALDVASVGLDLIADSGEVGAFNIWGIVYVADDPTCPKDN